MSSVDNLGSLLMGPARGPLHESIRQCAPRIGMGCNVADRSRSQMHANRRFVQRIPSRCLE
jgi:hypothetical protein